MAGAAASSRAVTLTASPVASFWSRVGSSVATTSPVFTPVRFVSSHAEARLQILVDVVQHLLHADGGPHRAQRVVLVRDAAARTRP